MIFYYGIVFKVSILATTIEGMKGIKFVRFVFFVVIKSRKNDMFQSLYRKDAIVHQGQLNQVISQYCKRLAKYNRFHPRILDRVNAEQRMLWLLQLGRELSRGLNR